MVNVILQNEQVIFEIKGLHRFWAMKDRIKVSRKNILDIYQDKSEITFWKGFRAPGTEIPGIIAAGTFYKNGRNFWDVVNKKNTIIIELKDERYKKLYIEVDNPDETIRLLKSTQQ
jgi:hypothetical protein